MREKNNLADLSPTCWDWWGFTNGSLGKPNHTDTTMAVLSYEEVQQVYDYYSDREWRGRSWGNLAPAFVKDVKILASLTKEEFGSLKVLWALRRKK